jgi:predicted NAD/FAD-dependent oxidoreductase
VVGGDKPGLSFAGLCAARGRSVTVVEQSGVFGATLGLPGRFRLVADLEAAGVKLVTGTVSADVPGVVTVTTGEGRQVMAADTVVIARPARAAAPLADACRAAGRPAHVVGDCRALAGIAGATADAVALAASLAADPHGERR